MAAKFFNKLTVPIPLMIGMKSPKRNAKQDRELTLTFRLPLDGNRVKSAPDFVRSAYEELMRGSSSVSLKMEIDNLDVDLFNLPEHKRATIRLPRLHLQSLAVKEVKNSEGDISRVLVFQAEYPWDSAVWEYLGDHYNSEVFAKFDAAQASLIDTDAEEEEEDEDQGDLEMEEVEEEEEEEEPVEA